MKKKLTLKNAISLIPLAFILAALYALFTQGV